MKDNNNRRLLGKLNEEIKKCERCPLSASRTQPLAGEGNSESRLFLIAQAPGDQEDAEGKMFIGPSGKIFRELLDHAGLSWDDFYVTNLLKCRLPRCRRPKQKEILACSMFLNKEIALIDPDIIVPLGFQAARYIFWYYKGVVLQKNDYSEAVGTLIRAGGKRIYPLSHPASVIYQPELKEGLLHTYKKLSVLKQACKWYPVCPIHHMTSQGILDKRWTELYCLGDWSSCVRFAMEERGEYHPDTMLPDGTMLAVDA